MFPSPSPSDEELLRQYEQGDAGAFRTVVERYATPIYNLAYRFAHDRMEAENIAQETFLRVVTSLHRIRLDEPFKPYLFRIAVNLCRDIARKKHALLFSDLSTRGEDSTDDASDSFSDDAPELWERLAEEELQSRLRKAVEQLPAHYQTAIILRYIEEFSYEDIAKTLDLPLNTVRTHLRRAKQQLRLAIEKDSQPKTWEGL
jgi:RNA polymerase sigma-70 factor (ECF subfamily)